MIEYTDDQIVAGVRESIADALKIPIDEVKRDSVLTDDLGASSIDFVDIMFKLESQFDIRFHPGNPLDQLSESFGPDLLVAQGVLTELGTEVVRRRLPEIDASKVRAGTPVANVQALYTTDTWVRGVKELLAARPTACPACGSQTLRPVRQSVLLCEGCQAEVDCPSQDELLASWAKRFQSLTDEGARGGEAEIASPKGTTPTT